MTGTAPPASVSAAAGAAVPEALDLSDGRLLASLRGWRSADRPAVLVRAIALSGFGGRRDGEVVAWPLATPQHRVGVLFGGLAAASISAMGGRVSNDEPVVVGDVSIGDDDAVGGGLACGGSATLLAQLVSSLPEALLDALDARTSVVLATDTTSGASAALRAGHDAEPALHWTGAAPPDGLAADALAAARRLLSGVGARRRTVETGARRCVVELFAPPSRMVVVGAGEPAAALVRQGALLGWDVAVIDERTPERDTIGPRCGALGPVDAVVVLSHAMVPSCEALASALTGRCGYVGALGSRHTQSARAERLRAAHGCDDAALARVHGPVGLDLGSRTPEETALAIFAEALAVRSGRSAASLAGGSGPING